MYVYFHTATNINNTSSPVKVNKISVTSIRTVLIFFLRALKVAFFREASEMQKALSV